MAFALVPLLAGCSGVSQPETASCRIAPPPEPYACTMEWDPVCGCDGKTYGNACTARGAGVTQTTPGACEEPVTR